MRLRRWTLKTKTRRDVQPSRPRRDETFQKNVLRPPRDRDVPKNVSRSQCRSLKTPTGEVSHLTCFLRVRSIIFFVIYSHCMHVHKTKVKRPRPRRYIFKTETRPRRSTFKTETRRDVPKKRLETETFKTETTSLVPSIQFFKSGNK